ncbi:MAG TPA: chemotaxis protein CheW [Polyangiaceae bacterium]
MANLSTTAPSRLARRTQERGPVREFLVFTLANETYAVDLTRVKEILSPPPITRVPRASREVLGVCSVRGLLVTVVDLRRKLRVEERALTRRARILLTSSGDEETFGLLVDEVKHVVRLSSNELELAAAALGGDTAEYVMGVGRPEGEFLILLDLKAISVS